VTDWGALHAVAEDARAQAYAPYSGFHVGAAALTTDGRVVSGCNVENAGYGVTLCAECGLVSELVRGGGGRLAALVCLGGLAADAGHDVLPCGRCRQLLWEHGGAELLVRTPRGVRTMAELLPDAFGPEELR
jgi:cytidine deaminase